MSEVPAWCYVGLTVLLVGWYQSMMKVKRLLQVRCLRFWKILSKLH